ncbi:hypothetical protein BD408DRAFT_412376 [Parasitella parasitica]|nr:hypothetical protein BD408DRAFT_412376 [Parasitella parasitica]
MSNNSETSAEKDNISELPKAVLIPNFRSQALSQANTITFAPASEHSNVDKANSTDTLVRSFKQCIDSSLEPLVRRIETIEKAMLDRTAAIAQQVSIVSINQQTLHQTLLNIVDKLDELQFDDQSVYTGDSCSSFDVPVKRSSNNADNGSACSTETSEFQPSEETYSVNEEEDPSNDFQSPEYSGADTHNQTARTESRKYTSKFNTSQTASPYTNHDNNLNASNLPHSSKTIEQTKKKKLVTQVAPVQVPTIPLLPATSSAAKEISIMTAKSEQAAALASASMPIILPTQITTTTPAPIDPPKTTVLATRDESTPTRQSNKSKFQNKGFTYLYINSRLRHYTEVKENLCTLGIASSKILDVHFPGAKVAAILFPDDYLHDATDIFIKYNIPILLDFDPLDPKNLGDPKYKNLPLAKRAKLLQDFHSNQIRKALNSMKEPFKFEVVCDFEKKGWITKDLAAKFALEAFLTKPKDNGNRNQNRNRQRNRNPDTTS